MKKWIRVVPLVAALAVGGAAGPAFAQALPPEVAAVQASITAACATSAPGILVDEAGCLAAIAAAIQTAASLPVPLQGPIGIIIGDVAEAVPSILDAVTALIQAAGLPALIAGFSVGLSNPGPTNPMAFSPA
ncbi:MAG: hypothetical protein AB7O56_03835 [Bauldia sp.]